MIPKTYPIEKVETVAKAIESAPILPQKSLTQEQILKKLAKQIKALQVTKNYAPNEIVALLKESGVKVTVREIKNLLEKPKQKTTQKKSEKTVKK